MNIALPAANFGIWNPDSNGSGFRKFAKSDLVKLALRLIKHEIVEVALECRYTKTSIEYLHSTLSRSGCKY